MVLVDSNVLIDIFTRDVRWYDWSSEALLKADDAEGLAINPIIYAEVGAVARTRARRPGRQLSRPRRIDSE